MPQVPERPLSRGELFNRNNPTKAPLILENGQEKQEKRYWRHKRKKVDGILTD